MSIPCILIPLLIGLISAYLGYLLGKMGKKSKGNNKKYKEELEDCHNKNARLQADYDNLKASQSSSKLGFVQTETSIPFNSDMAFAVLGKKVKQDDLKIVEGIGPKIEELFHNSGIKTWKHLGETSVEKCQQILDNAGDKYKVHNPGTWPKQSQMAYEGKWNELKAWQDTLDGGKE